ncbi:MAG TPA: hypothetical protein VFX16_32965 [Pseudonocardiaceae bacterium]|nr:hypothetical protein [Pseudonocardiaceae bacterium]
MDLFPHPPRDDFAATMTDEEREVWARHFAMSQQLLDDDVLVLAGGHARGELRPFRVSLLRGR